jgi:glycosyltransferase involved in cell wall biosynthesis
MHAHFLGEAIESVLAQTYRRVEVIVVDDGSPDDTALVAGRYPSVRCVRQPNQGLAAARNRGFRESGGDYLVFLDADDRLLPEALALGVAELRAHPESAFVSAAYRNIAEDGEPLPTPPWPLDVGADHYRELLLRNYIGVHNTVMYCRWALEAIGGFDVTRRAGEDYDLYLRIARRFPIARHPAMVAEYRRYATSMSRDPARMLRAMMQILHAQRPHVRGHRQYEDAYRRGIRHFQNLYGERLVERIRRDMHAHRWRPALAGALVLLAYCPRGFVMHLSRKTFRVLARLSSNATAAR